jgi:WD40 repeat protein
VSPAKPRFELTHVAADSPSETPEVVPFEDASPTRRSDRREFIGMGLTAAAVLAATRPGAARATPQRRGATGACLWAHGEAVLSLAASPTADLLVSGGDGPDGPVKLWGLPEGNLIKKLRKGKSKALSLAITPNGKLLVTGGGPAKGGPSALKLWSLPSGASLRQLGGNPGNVSGLSISADGKLLASVSSVDHTVKLWSLPAGKLVGTLKTGPTFSVALSRSSKLVATGGPGGFIQLWSLDGELITKTKAHAGDVLALAIGRNGKLLASGDKQGKIKLWRLPSLTLIKALDAHSARVQSLALSSGEKLLASASFDRTVKLWRVPGGSLARSMIGHTDKVSAVVFTRSGTTLASGGYDKTIRLWDVKTGKPKQCLTDIKANPASKKGTTITRKNARGETVTWTQPCGTPIPAGAVCTCNCIPGGVGPACSCVGHQTTCTCNTICTCQGVCSCVGVSHYWYPN